MDITAKIEAVLFFKGEPVSKRDLSKMLHIDEGEISTALIQLKEKLTGGGMSIVEKDDSVLLATSGDASSLIEEVRKEELSKDIGKAGLETLSIVLYKGPIARSEIDYIRGVNSTFILRNLLIRGLVERVNNPGDQRSFLYKPTFELLTSLGVGSIKELPDFETVKNDLEAFMNEKEEEETLNKN